MARIYPFFDWNIGRCNDLFMYLSRVYHRTRRVYRLLLRVVYVCVGDDDGFRGGYNHTIRSVAIIWRDTFERTTIYYTVCNDYNDFRISIRFAFVYADEIVLWRHSTYNDIDGIYLFYHRPNGGGTTTFGLAYS